MKTTLLLITLALASCTAFTAPADPVTGIRQDAPEEWDESFNPLDTPGLRFRVATSEGHFGHEWMLR